MKQIDKKYPQPFLLESTKFTRLVGLINDCLSVHKQTITSHQYEVTLSGNRREVMTSIDEVLALENSRKQKIKRLLIVSSGTTQGAARPAHEIQVDFAAPRSETNTSTGIAVSVRSEDAGWAGRTLSEIEEQVERTRLPYLPAILVLLGVLILLGLLAMQFLPFAVRVDRVQTMWLRDADLDRVEKILGQDNEITDDESKEIMSMQLKNVLDQRATNSPGAMRRGQWMFFVAMAVVLASAVVLFTTCYPSAVFLWGDEVERHADILNRRRVAWTIIMGVMIVGVLSKAFYEGVQSLLP
jgi:hypothetical protein